MGGKFHLKLNTGERPIANKYREGKMKRTLKRESKELEIVKREAIETGSALRSGLRTAMSRSLTTCQASQNGFDLGE
jgi:hypothetical protein